MSDWDLRKLQQSLEKAGPKPLYFIYGEEQFLVDQAVRALIDKSVPPESKDFNYDNFIAPDVTAARVREAAEQLPMMAERRMVIYKNVDALKDKDWEELLPILTTPVESTVLVLVAEKVDKRKKIFKTVAQEGVVVELRKPFENQIPTWVDYIAHLQGLKLDNEALSAIIQLVGTNLSEIASEMKKLRAYVGERSIVKLDDVLAVVSKARIESVFSLTEAIAQQDRAAALQCLANLLEHGQNEMGILALVLRQLRIFSLINAGMKRGLSGARLSAQVGVPEFFLKKYMLQARHWDESKIHAAIRALIETDRALKSSRVSSHIWLENFILKTC